MLSINHQTNWRLLLLLAIGFSLHGLVSSSGYMTIQFQRYYNADGRCSDGTYCDTVLMFNWKESPCDPQFRLSADRSNPGGTGLFDYQQGNWYDNQDAVDFGGTFGEIANPVRINLNYNDNLGTMYITVNVVDKDTSVNDHMDTFSTALQASGPEHRSLNLYSQPMNNLLSLIYWYTCHANFYGPLCNTYCLARDDATNGHYTCDANGQKVCLAGWIGPATDCRTRHPCSAGVCQNGASCTPQGEAYACHCLADYSGVNCQQFLDPCLYRNPCQNGAQCLLDAAKQPQCRCPPEFTGASCGQDVDECARTGDAYPCANDMPCVNIHGGFQCNCTDPHFAGRLCQLNVCNGTICRNNGTCNPSFESGPICACLDGFVGNACETDVDDCAGGPCQNGATCRDLVANFTCDCLAGFAGRLCQTNLDDCADVPCQNGGTCVDGVAGFNCTCRPGYDGRVCELSTTTTPWSRLAPGLLVGGTPDSAAASGESVSVAGVAAGSVVGFLVLLGIGTFLGVWVFRNRVPGEHIPDDTSSAFSNAVYNNAADVCSDARGGTNAAAASVATPSSIVVVEDDANAIYEDLGSASRVNHAYEVDA